VIRALFDFGPTGFFRPEFPPRLLSDGAVPDPIFFRPRHGPISESAARIFPWPVRWEIRPRKLRKVRLRTPLNGWQRFGYGSVAERSAGSFPP